jgi:hypothetical protein
LSFWLLVDFMVLANAAFAGAALFYLAKPMSERYNAWTTRLRERYPKISKPPTPEKAMLNYKIMVIWFRVVGALVFADAVYYLFLAIRRVSP